VFSEEFDTKFEALKPEQQIKRWTRAKKEALIASNYTVLEKLLPSAAPPHPGPLKSLRPPEPLNSHGSGVLEREIGLSDCPNGEPGSRQMPERCTSVPCGPQPPPD
jgi:hypothetical protein